MNKYEYILHLMRDPEY